MLHDTTDKHFTYSVELLPISRFTAHDLFYITLLRQSYDVIILYNSATCYMTQQTNISLILQSYCSAVDLLHMIFFTLHDTTDKHFTYSVELLLIHRFTAHDLFYITLLRQSYDIIILYNSAACYMTQQTNISLILQSYCSAVDLLHTIFFTLPYFGRVTM